MFYTLSSAHHHVAAFNCPVCSSSGKLVVETIIAADEQSEHPSTEQCVSKSHLISLFCGSPRKTDV